MRKTQIMSEGALMCTLTLLLAWLNQYSGFLLEAIFPWLYAFPLLIYAARYGFRFSSLPLISTCLLAVLFTSWTSFFYLSAALLLGVVYGTMVHHQKAQMQLFLISFLAAFIVNLLTMFLLAGIFGYDIQEDLVEIDHLLQTVKGIQLPKAESIFFFSLVLLSFLQTVCVHVLAQLVLIRLKIQAPKMKKMNQISSPRWLGVIILLIWLLYFLQSVVELQVGIQLLIQSAALCALLAAIVYGALSIFTYLALRHVSKRMVVLVYLLLFVPIVHLLFALLGELDLLFGLRKAMR